MASATSLPAKPPATPPTTAPMTVPAGPASDPAAAPAAAPPATPRPAPTTWLSVVSFFLFVRFETMNGSRCGWGDGTTTTRSPCKQSATPGSGRFFPGRSRPSARDGKPWRCETGGPGVLLRQGGGRPRRLHRCDRLVGLAVLEVVAAASQPGEEPVPILLPAQDIPQPVVKDRLGAQQAGVEHTVPPGVVAEVGPRPLLQDGVEGSEARGRRDVVGRAGADHDIVPGSALQGVRAQPAQQQIAPTAAPQDVRPGAAGEHVVFFAAALRLQRVVALPAEQEGRHGHEVGRALEFRALKLHGVV